MSSKKILLGLLFCFLLIPSVTGLEAGGGKRVLVDHTIPDTIEDIVLQTEYNLPTDLNSWCITDNKAINMSVHVKSNPQNKTILIEHMHADVFIESTNGKFDGVTQDSMDDYIHGSDQSGFLINENYSYYEVFSIEGSSVEFTKYMIYLYLGYYAGGSSHIHKLDHEFLVNECGVYGETLYFVYDVLVKEGDYFHKYIITDNIFVSANGTIFDNDGNTYDQPHEIDQPIPGYDLGIIGLITVVIITYIAKKRR